MDTQTSMFEAVKPQQVKNTVNAVESTAMAKAVRLRMKHDIGGHRIKKNEYTLTQVKESVKAGFNFYTGEKLDFI